MVIPLFVGRDKSITALNEVMKSDKKIILVTQKNSEVDDPKKNDVYSYGCDSNILQLLKLPDGTVKVLVEGIKRVKILDFKDDEKFITCTYEPQKDVLNKDEDLPHDLYNNASLYKFLLFTQSIPPFPAQLMT